MTARMLLLSLTLGIFFSANLQAHLPLEDLFKGKKEIVATYKAFDYHLGMLDINSKEIEILGVDIKNNLIDLYLTKDEYRNLRMQGYNLEVQEDSGIPLAPDNQYLNPEEVSQFVEEMHRRFPELTKLVSIGKSIEGRDIWALKISDNPEAQEKDEPVVLFNSMHHAREVMTPEVAVDIITHLLERYDTDDQVRRWVDNTEIYVLPMLNVDGNNKVWSGSSMWRKNTRGGYGVDINRNYPYKWGSCNGSSGSRWSDTYRGDSAGSEPETQALMNFVASIRPTFSISFHSYSEMVLYPYGCQGQKTETEDVVANIGKEMGRLIDYTAGTPWEILYGVDGGDIDWMYGEYQVIPYVIEVSSRSEGFQPRYDQWRDKTVSRVRPAWQLLLNRVHQNGIRGKVEGLAKDQAFVVKVSKITAKGPVSYMTYKGSSTGTYHLVLNPGNYQLTFEAPARGAKRVLEVSVDQSLKVQDVTL